MASTAAQVPYAHAPPPMQQQPPPRTASNGMPLSPSASSPGGHSFASGPSQHLHQSPAQYEPSQQFGQLSLGPGEDDEYAHHPHIPSRPVLDDAAQSHSQAQIHGVPLPQAHNQAFPEPVAQSYGAAATAGGGPAGNGMSYPSGGGGGQAQQRQSYAPVPGFAPSGAGSVVGGGGGGSVVGGSTVGGGQREVSGAMGTMPLLDNSHLRPGAKAALLSHDKTLELYRANAKKTNDPELIFEFAVFMIEAAKSLDPSISSGSVPALAAAGANPHATAPLSQVVEQKRDDLIKEAVALLKRLADRGHPDAQYFLADCYSNGIGTIRGRQDFDRAFPLFVLAAKHGHPDASYRAGTCCEHGWGCRRESNKAIQFYKKAAAASHPGAMYRLGTAELNGSLGLSKRPKEGVKWLKRSAEHATPEFPHALHELALLHERGIDNVLFVDLEYASELLAQAAELGYAPSAFKLGECYEYGKMGCPMDAALSIHYYNIAAQQNHREGCFALTAWYLVGSPGVLPQSDTEAFLWAKKAAEMGLAKAQYAVGYFIEVGIGTPASPQTSIQWYKLAAENGDRRADKRLKNISANGGGALTRVGTGKQMLEAARREEGEGGGKEGCVIM